MFAALVGGAGDGGAVRVHRADAGLHALVRLPAQPACSCLGPLQVGIHGRVPQSGGGRGTDAALKPSKPLEMAGPCGRRL